MPCLHASDRCAAPAQHQAFEANWPHMPATNPSYSALGQDSSLYMAFSARALAFLQPTNNFTFTFSGLIQLWNDLN